MAADSKIGSAKRSRQLMVTKGLDGLNLIAISLAAILCLTSWGTVFYNHKVESSRQESRLFFCDFAKYYVCGKLAISEDRYKAYDRAVQADYTARFALGDAKVQEEFIHYPPMDFPLMAPLSALSFEHSFLAFCFLGNAIFIAGTFLLNRATACFANFRILVFFWLAVFGSVPMLRTFVLGQTSVFLTGIIALYVFSILKDRPAWGGIALALTSIKPQYTLFLAIPALAQRRYKLIIWAALCEVLMILGAVATIGIKNVINYPAILLHSEQTVELAGAFVSEMVNVRGLLANLFDDSIAAKTSAIFALLAMTYLAFLWLKFCRDPKDSPQARLLLAITVMFALTFSPHTHLYDCLFVAVALLAAGNSSLTAAISADQSAAQKIFACLLLAYPVAGWCFLILPQGTGAVHTAPFAVYNLALCLTATVALFSLMRRPQPQN
jgi:hypothetical protein